MASVQTYKSGLIRIVDGDRVVMEIEPRRTESGNPAAMIRIGDAEHQLYDRSLRALITTLQEAIAVTNS